MTDLCLLAAYVHKKDTEAFKSLVLNYQGLVVSTCRRHLDNDADVQDAAQRVFIALMENAHRINRNLGGWLHQCATNTSISLVRSESARKQREKARAVRDRCDDDRVVWKEIQGIVDECLDELDPSDKEILIQNILLKKPQAQIAEHIGVSQQAIGKRVTRALEKLRRRLRRRGVAVTLATLAATLEDHAVAATVRAGLATALAQIGVTGAKTGTVILGSATGGAAATSKLKIAAVIAATVVMSAAPHTPLTVTVPVEVANDLRSHKPPTTPDRHTFAHSVLHTPSMPAVALHHAPRPAPRQRRLVLETHTAMQRTRSPAFREDVVPKTPSGPRRHRAPRTRGKPFGWPPPPQVTAHASGGKAVSKTPVRQRPGRWPGRPVDDEPTLAVGLRSSEAVDHRRWQRPAKPSGFTRHAASAKSLFEHFKYRADGADVLGWSTIPTGLTFRWPSDFLSAHLPTVIAAHRDGSIPGLLIPGDVMKGRYSPAAQRQGVDQPSPTVVSTPKHGVRPSSPAADFFFIAVTQDTGGSNSDGVQKTPNHDMPGKIAKRLLSSVSDPTVYDLPDVEADHWPIAWDQDPLQIADDLAFADFSRNDPLSFRPSPMGFSGLPPLVIPVTDKTFSGMPLSGNGLIALTVTAVPEPGSLFILWASAAGLWLVKRRI